MTLNREELIEQVAVEWQDEFGPWGGPINVERYAAAAVDAVLSAVADRVEAMTSSGRSDWSLGFDDGTSAAAGYIRSLLTTTEGTDDDA